MTITVTNVTFTAAPAIDQLAGLLGWARVEINGAIVIDGVAVRRARAGQLVVSFPARRDRHGTQHSIVAPLDAATHVDLERQVLAELHRQGRLAS